MKKMVGEKMRKFNKPSVLMRVDPTFKELVDGVAKDTSRTCPQVTRDFTYKIKRGFNLTVKDWF